MGRKESKKQKESNINDFDTRFKDSISALLSNLKSNKDVYVLLCTALGLVLNAFWNVACGAWYKGYADGLSIQALYIYKDNQNILISVMVFLGTAVACYPIVYAIYRLAKKVYRSTLSIFILIFTVILALNPLIMYVVYLCAESTHDFINNYLVVFVLVSFFSFAFALIYLPILIALKDIDKKKRNEQDNAQQDQRSTFSKVIICAKAIIAWVFAALCFLVAIYWFGCFSASSQMEFEFIVDKYDYSFTYDGNVAYDNIILSETDELYYLSVCRISGSADNATITIYPNYHSIVKKGDEPINVIKKRFSTTHFVK